MPTYVVLEFNINRRIRNKSYEEAKIWDILRPGKTQAGTRDTEAEIRDVPGNTGRLATLSDDVPTVLHTVCPGFKNPQSRWRVWEVLSVGSVREL